MTECLRDSDTTSQGLAVVVIHSASGLSDTDAGSKSDPFVILEWSKLGKAMSVVANIFHVARRILDGGNLLIRHVNAATPRASFVMS